jgi:hypothetical protein
VAIEFAAPADQRRSVRQVQTRLDNACHHVARNAEPTASTPLFERIGLGTAHDFVA